MLAMLGSIRLVPLELPVPNAQLAPSQQPQPAPSAQPVQWASILIHQPARHAASALLAGTTVLQAKAAQKPHHVQLVLLAHTVPLQLPPAHYVSVAMQHPAVLPRPALLVL